MSTVDLSSARWRKSSRSGGNGSDSSCVEVAFSCRTTAIRDSKNPAGPVLLIPATNFTAFLNTTKHQGAQ
ncbi:DUF397 domain-containing protein [Solihabitans fulvus]|uniref:DUF397 domain-containing protein n=1 Tax=Solihabitans fulvus TaxID=1892852 RepID=A0A5B2WU18_9PSEU|nr:DUF397 domain-containing protein [Solihabitans fulvus]KAA2255241.1 DUF397 domain-containing protein [Solihabitans fulvus]